MNQREFKQTYQPKGAGRKEIFRSSFAEIFTKTHPVVAISLFILIGILLFIYAVYNQVLLIQQLIPLLFLGIFTFTLVEYLVHRFVFHMELTNRIREKIQYGAHGVHHEFPNDRARLVMPPLLSIPLATIVFLFVQLIIGNSAFGLMSGFFIGYGLYLFVHYIVHAWKMPKNRFKSLWIYHNIHHFQNEEVAFGVTSHFWDRVFGTMPEIQKGKTKK